MTRRVDGLKFQAEFEAAIKGRYYVQRLYNLNTGYSGLTQPADFLVLGAEANFVELKETGSDRFYVSALQQLSEIEALLEWKSCYGGKMRYYLIVHFIEQGIFKVITAEKVLELLAARKSLRFDGDEGLTFGTLLEIKEAEIF